MNSAISFTRPETGFDSFSPAKYPYITISQLDAHTTKKKKKCQSNVLMTKETRLHVWPALTFIHHFTIWHLQRDQRMGTRVLAPKPFQIYPSFIRMMYTIAKHKTQPTYCRHRARDPKLNDLHHSPKTLLEETNKQIKNWLIQVCTCAQFMCSYKK